MFTLAILKHIVLVMQLDDAMKKLIQKSSRCLGRRALVNHHVKIKFRYEINPLFYTLIKIFVSLASFIHLYNKLSIDISKYERRAPARLSL